MAGLVSWTGPFGRAQPADPGDDQAGAEVLTRGPVHEAFAGVISYNPEPGVTVSKPPPEPIEEIPPEERPEGDDVAWIPGYWAWDDERDDYLWISGTWRTLPPGREWVAGYWRDTGRGHQWISGYWADMEMAETTYLPPPPETLETGPNVPPPSLDYDWAPGCWMWHDGRYAWRAGYWTLGRADWIWIPACYVWTPRGYIYVAGFWDYPLERRGLLYAPVYYHSHTYVRRGYSYSPRIVVNLTIFTDHLFLRPSYHHYYFGDYYGSRYDRGGFHVSFSYQSSRYGYDPFYSRRRWEHRRDRDWEDRFQASYRYRRENETARPPRTWAAQMSVNTGTVAGAEARIMMAAPARQLAATTDHPMRFQPVAREDRQQLARRGQEVQQSREQRRTIEARAAVTTGREAVEPARVAQPKSPIAARSRGRDAAPPETPRAPVPNPEARRAEPPGRRPDAGQRTSPDDIRRSGPARPDPRERQRTVPEEREETPAPARRPNPAAERVREEQPSRVERESQRQTQQDAERRNRDAAEKSRADEERRKAERVQEEPRRNEERARQEVEERRNRDAAAKADAAERARQEAEERANARGTQVREESERKVQQRQMRPQPQPEAARRARDAAAQAEAAKAKQAAKEKAAREKAEEEEKEKGRPRNP